MYCASSSMSPAGTFLAAKPALQPATPEATAARPRLYNPRHPERTLLYQTIWHPKVSLLSSCMCSNCLGQTCSKPHARAMPGLMRSNFLFVGLVQPTGSCYGCGRQRTLGTCLPPRELYGNRCAGSSATQMSPSALRSSVCGRTGSPSQ